MSSTRAVAEPSACGHCGIPARAHYQQWTKAAGWHQWAAPTNAQILARMQARRAARLAPAPANGSSSDLLLTLTFDAGPLRAALAEVEQALQRPWPEVEPE